MAAATDFRSSVDIPPPQRERMGSMSLGQPPAGENGGSVANGGAPPTAVTSPTGLSNPNHIDAPKEVQDVLQSEIGVSAMLNRLKQSIASVREFAMFLKKRGQLEQDHSNHLKKLSQGTMETMSRGEHKGGTFASAYSQMMETHNRMADNGVQFGQSLQTMHEDLLELAAMAEKNRKGWKQNGLAAEQRVADLETAMRKSKAKYESLAEEYDRVRTGDTGGQRPKFGFKGHKSAAQQEEDLLRKVQAADEDYKGKVQTYQVERSELIKTARPDAVKALHDNIRECDSGLALQMQKFASFNEKLLLSNGLSISPLKGPGKPDARSLKEIASSIDNERDLNEYIGGHHNKLPPRTGEPVYERHPVLDNTRQNAPPSQAPSAVQSPTQAMGQPPMGPGPAQQPASMSSRTGPIGGFPDASQSPGGAPPMGPVPVMPAAQRQGSGQHERSFSHSSMYGQGNQGQQQSPFSTRNSAQPTVPNSRFNTSANSSQGPPQLGALSFQTSQPQQPPQLQGPPGPQGPISNPLMSHPPNQRPGSSGLGQVRAQSPPQMAPTKPVFGISLSRLYDRDALAVPMVVYQCIQAVDLYGLSVEGIYRLSGSVPHVNKLKGMFDTGDSNSANLDFRNPENFFHDVNSVAGLLKQFFRDLPDPLLTKEHYSGFIEAAKNDDDIVRRDSLHAIINSLPDPNYATLRALTLHLHRVMENSKVNRMSSQNLAIVFGPTLMGTGSGSNIADAGWQVRAVDTILQNTYQIFDDD